MSAQTVYLYISSQYRGNLDEKLRKYYQEKILITRAPYVWGCKLENVSSKEEEALEKEFAKKADGIMYLCNYLCDGRPNLVFPD